MKKGKGVSVRGPATGIVVFAVLALFSSLLLWTTLQNTVAGSTATYTATFTDATGLHSGDDVRIAGVKVGRIESMEIVDNQAEVEFTVQQTQPIFENTRAVIRYQNLIGQRYLALRPGKGKTRPIPDGGRIPADRTEPSLDLTALLGGFEPLFDLLQPDELNRLSGNIINSLQGEGPALQDLLEQSATLTTDLAAKDEVIGDVITNLTQVMDHLAGRTDEFETLIARAKKMVNGLAADGNEIIGAVDSLDRTAKVMTGLIRDVRPALVVDIKKFNQVADLYLDEGPAVEDTLQALPPFAASFARVTNYGSWANLYACAITVDAPLVPADLIADAGGTRHTEVCR